MSDDNIKETHHTDDEDDSKVLQQTYERITRSVIQNGYADGVADGRDTLYQKDFDRGYQAGLLMAFQLGQHQGYALGLSHSGSEIVEQNSSGATIIEKLKNDLILKPEASRAHCQMCLDRSLESKQLEDICTIQDNHNRGIKDKLSQRFKLFE